MTAPTDYERDQARVAAELAAGATTVVSAHGNHANCRNCGVEGHVAPEPAHAPLAPSASAHWVNCAGWLKMSRLFPERPDTQSALEGTAAHWVLSEALAGRIHPVGTLAPNGIAVTQEMHEGAELFISNIPDEVMGAGGCIHVEDRLPTGSIHDDVWGTPDVWWVRDNVLHVVDYKFGHGFVDEWMNWQLICYVDMISTLHPQFTGIDIELTICQPRCFAQDGAWRTWRTNEQELRPLIAMLRKAAAAAQDPDAPCTSGSHCAHCSAIVHCPAHQTAVSNALHVTAVADASNMPLEAMGLLRSIVEDARAILKNVADGMDIELEAAIRSGRTVPGWALEPGRGKTEWSVPVGEVVTFGDMFGVTLRKDAVITPIQARKELTKAGVDPALLAGYTKDTAGALKLVKSEVGAFRRVFG